jgi:N-acetylmuramoyl-L-alanine amidase
VRFDHRGHTRPIVDSAIRLGDRGEPVVDLQRRLRGAGAADLAVDGRFGPATFQAVRRFQQERGLTADGQVGPETWRSLVEASYRLGDRLLWHSQVLMRGDDVREAQELLNLLGFNAGPQDGIFGPLAQAAVEEFQRNVGVDVDGVVGPDTVAMLRRLRRGHQAAGAANHAREREWLRELAGRGLAGARIMIDPAHGPDDPGAMGSSGLTEAEAAWEVATRLTARLSAQGAQAWLARGPHNTPSPSDRARVANELGTDLVLGIGANALGNPAACGAASYYYGTAHSFSETGRLLAELAQDEMVAAGWWPDCRVHAVTWSLLRETRMPAVTVEPGFITSPTDEARLGDPREQDRLADALMRALTRLLSAPVATAS